MELINDSNIRTCNINEKIKYIGINFESKVVFNEIEILSNLKEDLQMLCNSPLLHADQKLKKNKSKLIIDLWITKSTF